jgi:hypothetical protein
MELTETKIPKPKPPRHGWGGNKKRRAQALLDRQEEEIERQEIPWKFGLENPANKTQPFLSEGLDE